MSVIIRPATTDDIDFIYSISSRVHLNQFYKTLIPDTNYSKFLRIYTPDPVRTARFREKIQTRLSDPAWQIFVAEEKGSIVGYTMSIETSEAIELRGLFVDEKHQGQGIGRQLFETSLATNPDRKPVFLEVLEKNTKARGMYEKAGFEQINTDTRTFYGAALTRMAKY